MGSNPDMPQINHLFGKYFRTKEFVLCESSKAEQLRGSGNGSTFVKAAAVDGFTIKHWNYPASGLPNNFGTGSLTHIMSLLCLRETHFHAFESAVRFGPPSSLRIRD